MGLFIFLVNTLWDANLAYNRWTSSIAIPCADVLYF
jgi:hypothetical protein